jgi:serine/threonine protein kinase
VENLPPDSFPGKVRTAKPAASVASAPSPAATSAPKKPVVAAPLENLPPELAALAKYRFIRELGRGGMGVVYQAEQTLMGRAVAVKVINPSVLAHPDALPRFHAEVKAAARLDHANIVRAHDAQQVGSLHLLVMEYVEGVSLAELVAQKGPRPVAHACHYIRQAALGLQHAFEQGMTHRDVKPQNLMVTQRGVVKVLDFGLARLRSEGGGGSRGLTEIGAFMGTPEYVSPEQATDAHTADTRADIYSLGCTLYFLLTGRPPFQEDTVVKLVLAQIEKEPQPVHELRAGVPPELSEVLRRMLAKDPAQRFQQPVEVAQALVPFIKTGAKAPAVNVPASSNVASPGHPTAFGADTSRMKGFEKKALASAPAAPRKDEPASSSAQSAAAAKPIETVAAAKPRAAGWYRRPPVLVAAGATLVAVALAAWLGGIFNGETKDGTRVGPAAPAGNGEPREPSEKTIAARAGDRALIWNGLPDLPEAETSLPGGAKIVLASSQTTGYRWRYTLDKPAGDWFKPGFNDASWSEGPGGFGSKGTPGASVRTEWTTANIWMRREFLLPDVPFTNLALSVHHDDDAVIYLNGVLAANLPGSIMAYEDVAISREARATLTPGKNLIAVHCSQRGGGQYIDVGLVAAKIPLVRDAEDLRLGRIAAPDLSRAKPFLHDDFSDPNSGWDVALRAPGGRFAITKGEGGKAERYTNFACQVVGRVRTTSPEGRWGLVFSRGELNHKPRSIQVTFDRAGVLHVGPSFWDPQKSRGPPVGPLRHDAIKTGEEFNTLLAVVRRGLIDIYVNGVAVCDPILVGQDLSPTVVTLAVFGGAEAEFSRLTISPLDAKQE